MNAEVNVVSERALHPLAVTSESLQILAHWFKSNGTRQIADSDPRRMIIERYRSEEHTSELQSRM